MGLVRTSGGVPVVVSACLLGPLLTACTGGAGDGPDDGGSQRSTVVVDGLAQLPTPEETTALTVTVADVAAVSEANGLQRPASAEAALPGWVTAMTGSGEPGAALVVPPAVGVPASPVAFEEVAGFWWGEADRIASISEPTDQFSVLTGEDLPKDFPDGVPELGDGIWSIGEDQEPDSGTDPAIDSLGRPIRMAPADGRMALSFSTPLVETWLSSEGPRLDENASLRTVAEALDGAGVVSAVLQVQLPVPDAPATVGVGWGEDRSDPEVTIAYDYGSDDAARAAAEEVEPAFTDGTSKVTGQPYPELVDFRSATVSGQVLVVTVGVSPERVGVPYSMLQGSDLPLLVDQRDLGADLE